MVKKSTQHNIALIMLSTTAIVWGAGFLLSTMLLQNGFAEIPLTLNTIRFGIAAILLTAVFCRKLKFCKKLFVYGLTGGAMLFGGFALQLLGLNYTTPARCGFFTASYTLFVPFIIWIFRKKRPSLLVGLGILSALAGLIILNINGGETPQGSNELLGNALTLGGSLFFALQIVLADKALHEKQLDTISLTVVQVVFCALLFLVFSLIFECKNYSAVKIDWGASWWQLAIVGVLGTGFAYFSQTFAQSHLTPTETSIIIACESPIGAVFSVTLGMESLTWQICVGGLLAVLSVVLVEILPSVSEARKAKTERMTNDTDDDNIAQRQVDAVDNNHAQQQANDTHDYNHTQQQPNNTDCDNQEQQSTEYTNVKNDNRRSNEKNNEQHTDDNTPD